MKRVMFGVYGKIIPFYREAVQTDKTLNRNDSGTKQTKYTADALVNVIIAYKIVY